MSSSNRNELFDAVISGISAALTNNIYKKEKTWYGKTVVRMYIMGAVETPHAHLINLHREQLRRLLDKNLTTIKIEEFFMEAVNGYVYFNIKTIPI